MSQINVMEVLQELKKLYKPPKSFLNHKNPFELLVATILSAQCTDKVVNRVTEDLFKKYKKPEDYLKVGSIELEKDIHSCGTYKNKAKFIRGTCEMLIENYVGKVPDSMEELIKLPGVGRKTASIILYVAFGKLEGIAVDTHVIRLSNRLGLTGAVSQYAIEKDLMKQLPKKHWGEINPLLISHGRAICDAKKPKCSQCIFKNQCPSSSVAI